MSFNFVPKSEDELMKEKLLPNGEYDCLVKSFEAKVSKSGNSMVEVKLEPLDHPGRLVFDYLMESLLYKVKHFADSAGLQDDYNKGSLGQNAVGKIVRAKIFIREDKTGQYAPKNAVVDYLVKDTMAKQDAPVFDDVIPF